MTDIHRFWEQTGSFYARGMGSDNITDPFIGLGVIPAGSALFRDMTQIRFSHPEWDPEKCTGCGRCYAVCPDTAIPGLVNEVGQVLDTVVARVRKRGHEVEQLPRGVRLLERHLRVLFESAQESEPVAGLIEEAIDRTLRSEDLDAGARDTLRKEFDLFRDELGDFQLALSRPFYTVPESQEKGSGGLLSITVNPSTCKGCMECIEVCDDDALRQVPQTDASVEQLRRKWDFWLDLPTTPQRYMRIADLEQGIGPLENILLDKHAYQAFTSGDGACLGCAEKTAIHLFVATVESLMRPRVEKHVERLGELIARLERHVQLQLVGDIDISDPERVQKMTTSIGGGDLTLAEIAERMEREHGGHAIDPDWLGRMSRLVAKLKDLRWRYENGTSGRGRSHMGMLNATGCTSVWGSTYPFNPYPFPWANHLFQDSPSLAMGVFEGHMAHMAEGFRAIREAELELAGQYSASEHEESLCNLGWRDFTDEEWRLCPPVVAVGGDGAMYDIGFQNLSRLMASGHPIKVVVLDTQVYSNTGGQACTSGFLGQVSDMAQFGAATKGKQEPRKEIGLIGMAHRTTYVLQSTHRPPRSHDRRLRAGPAGAPPCPVQHLQLVPARARHRRRDERAPGAPRRRVARLSHVPLRPGGRRDARTSASTSKATRHPATTGPSYTLRYRERGREKTMEVPAHLRRLRDHRGALPQALPDGAAATPGTTSMVPLAEFLELDADEREGRFPFVWSVTREGELTRLMVDATMVESCEDRRHFWRMLRSLAGIDRHEISRDEVEQQVRQEVVGTIASNLMRLASEEGSAGGVLESLVASAAGETAPAPSEAAPTPTASDDGGMAPWIDTADCTACDECTNLNPQIFAYDDNGKAYIKDANAGPYRDLVKAAERCTAQVIHPGLPRKRDEKDIEKWIERAQRFN